MTRPRSQLISLEDTPYYHCISRCVRRAFLCGDDHYSSKNFDHRKPWIVERLRLLGNVFAIDIAAYAVMSNHYHLVLHVDQARSHSWSNKEVIRRWLKLYKGPLLIHRYMDGDTLLRAELEVVEAQIKVWRSRLSSISWYMACLNEYVARMANKEDNCKGRFWEGRFKSQALLDETALLSCMAYVDLNPIRAGISNDLWNSDFTSIQDRLQLLRKQQDKKRPRLMPFQEKQKRQERCTAIPYNLKEYINLVDWTGRHIRNDKRGFIVGKQPKLLALLGLSEAQWQVLALDIQKHSILMLHGIEKLAALEQRQHKTNKLVA